MANTDNVQIITLLKEKNMLNAKKFKYIWSYLILLSFASLSFADSAFFYNRKLSGNPANIEQVYRHHFPNCICSPPISVSHFGDSLNISKNVSLLYLF